MKYNFIAPLMYVFFDKRRKKNCNKLAMLSKKNLMVNLYIIKISNSWKKINTKEGFQYVCVPVILIDLVYRKNKNFCSQVFLEKYNFIVIEKKMSDFNDHVEIYSDDS